MRPGDCDIIRENEDPMSQEDKRELEDLIDKHTLLEVVETLSEICYEKARHFHMNYPDQNNNGQQWHDNGNALTNVLPKLED